MNEKLETFEFSDIVKYFKDPDRNALLRNNEKYSAVAIRENVGEKVKICMCVFDRERSTIVDNQFYIVEVNKVHDDLLKHFGLKDMIVLK